MEYPYQAFVLTPTFLVKEVMVVGEQRWTEWRRTNSGKYYLQKDIYESKKAALEGGAARLAEQEARLVKQASAIEKRRATLQKQQA